MTPDTVQPQQTAVPNFGRYISRRLIGEGGMGSVYLADDPVLEREVAVKVISVDKRLDQKTRDEYLKRFGLEARASARLHHQSIVSVYDAGEQEGVPWIAFEFVQGERLDQLLTREQRLPVDKAIAIALDIASALQHAHSQGIVHRDIKPSNILMEDTTRIAKIADFGIVKAPWVGLTKEGEIVGSPGYMSPEQINGLELDGRSDLFSLGVVLYELVSGKHPFVRETVAATLMATLGGAYTPLGQVCRDVPSCLDDVLRGSLAVERDKRIPSAEQFTLLLTSGESLTQYQSLRGRLKLGAGVRKDQPGAASALFKKTTRILDAVLESARKAQKVLVEKSGPMAARLGMSLRLFYRPLRKRVQPTVSIVRPSLRAPRTLAASLDTIRSRAAGVSAVSGRAISRLAQSMRSPMARWTAVAIAVVVAIWAGFAVWTFAGPAFSTRSLETQVKQGSLAQSLRAARRLQRRGETWPAAEIARRGVKYLEEDNIELAQMASEAVVKLYPANAQGLVLAARVALKSGEYAKALDAFSRVPKTAEGGKAMENDHVSILAQLGDELMRAKAPQQLIDAGSLVLSSADETIVRSWVESTNYWLRWNSVAILQAAKQSVDMVSVYILDLKHGADSETRVRAARWLGEFRDRRAVRPLQEAARGQKSDPQTAKAAKDALDKYLRR